jgi:nucleoid DNA-binding protein
MNKTELVTAIAEKSGLTKADSMRALDAFIDAVTESVAKDDAVALVGFGTFKVAERKERMGRNPQTGAEMKIAAAKLPRFVPGKGFKDAVNK